MITAGKFQIKVVTVALTHPIRSTYYLICCKRSYFVLRPTWLLSARSWMKCLHNSNPAPPALTFFGHPQKKEGFPGGSAGKESPCNAGDLGSIPGLGRSPGEGKGNPFQYSGLENSMDCIAHGVAMSWTWVSDFHQKKEALINTKTYTRYIFLSLTSTWGQFYIYNNSLYLQSILQRSKCVMWVYILRFSVNLPSKTDWSGLTQILGRVYLKVMRVNR